MDILNFKIKSAGIISESFLKRNMHTFKDASLFIANFQYGRNADKNQLDTVFTDNCGTCSTKHALLKILADENNFPDLKLMLGIFKMNGENTPPIRLTLEKFRLNYIPEAHNYLRYRGNILDFTRANSKPSDFEADLLAEIQIAPDQISDFKVGYHKDFLKKWLHENPPMELDELWKIREQCISDLSNA